MPEIDEKNSKAFLIEEYKTLRDEIKTKIADNRKFEIYAVTASAVIYSWLASQDKIRAFGWEAAWFLPLFVTAFCAYRNEASGAAIGRVAQYVLKIERAFFPDSGDELKSQSPSAAGWEHHLWSLADHKPANLSGAARLWRWLVGYDKGSDIVADKRFWRALIVFNVALGVYVAAYHPFVSAALATKG